MHYPPYVQGSDRVVMRFMPTTTGISFFTAAPSVGGSAGIGRFFPTFSATLPISGDAFNAEVDGINKAIETAGVPPTSPAVYLTGLVGLIGAIVMIIGIVRWDTRISYNPQSSMAYFDPTLLCRSSVSPQLARTMLHRQRGFISPSV